MGVSRSVVACVPDFDIVVSEFELQSQYCVRFQTHTLGKGMNPLIPPSLGDILSLLYFYKDTFGIKYSKKVDIPLNKWSKTI